VAIAVGIALLFTVLVLLAHLLASDDQARYDSYTRNCTEAGGHIYAPDDTAFCVRDGLWVEVYP
jgi:hypothetical protein